MLFLSFFYSQRYFAFSFASKAALLKGGLMALEHSDPNPNRTRYGHSPYPVRWWLLMLILTFLQTGCGSGVSPADRAAKKGILVLGNGAEPKALDPHLVTSTGDSNIMRALFEGLVTSHPSDDSKHDPGVATRWEPNKDFTQWTFFLRKEAKWSNGDPVTAHDFVYAYHRILSPKMAAPYASMLYFLKNGEEFNSEKIEDFSKVGVKAEDDHTLVCDLAYPAPYFPDVVKHSTYLPIHRKTIEKYGDWTDHYTDWQKPGNLVGNGAYQLTKWRINAHVKVRPNPHYWDKAGVKNNGIDFIPLDNVFTEERAFRDNIIHYTYTLPQDIIGWYEKNRPEVLRIETYAGSYFMRCNVKEKPMSDVNFRRALAAGINRETIVKYVTQGGQQPAYAFTPPSEGGYQPPNKIKFDPAKAKEYLKAAGYADGSEVPPFKILINTSESHKAIAEAIQDMWKTHLGIQNVSIGNQEWKVFQKTVNDIKYDVARSGWIGDYVDPTTFLNMWRTGDSNNRTGWSSEKYDSLISEAAQLSENSERYVKLQEAETVLLDELPMLPVYWYTRVYLLSPHIENWHPLLLDNHPYKHISLKVK